MFRIPGLMADFAKVLSAGGFQCWLVGGSVRDMARGHPPGDFDVATDARPEDVMRLFRSVIPTGIKHGTVTVRFRGHSIETTTFRAEEGYSDGRHPDRVEFKGDIQADLSRRDFTMNAMALDCISGRLLDPWKGMKDIKARLIRAVGDPLVRFDEDGLRPLRAIRFASVMGFSIETATLAAISARRGRIRMVAQERVREELCKAISGQEVLAGLHLLDSTRLLDDILPELACLRGLEQSPPHRFDALEHSFRACALSAPTQTVRWAALLHDCGKASARREDQSGIVSFFGHEVLSADLARQALTRLRFPRDFIEEVVSLISLHMQRYDESWTDAAVRRLIARAGTKRIGALLDLIEADEGGLTGTSPSRGFSRALRERVESLMAREAAFGLKDLAIGGEDLKALGLKPGPAMGRVLGELLEAVLDDPSLNEHERLRLIASRIIERDGHAG
jgi:putative nucleotidyltransferase with HDIG domain